MEQRSSTSKSKLLLSMLCGVVGLVIGGVIGHYASEVNEIQQVETIPQPSAVKQLQKRENYLNDKWMEEKDIIDKIVTRINRDNIKKNLRYLSQEPHLAGTPRDVELAKMIRDRFDEAGFDSASLTAQQFLLSRPDPTNPNKIRIEKEDNLIFESHHQEIPIHADDHHKDFIDAFSAYSPAGTMKTTPGVGVVYVNYGRIEDFMLIQELGVNVSGHIVLIKFGKIFRGNKVKHAEEFGAVGVILFSDPVDVAAEGTAPEDLYDNSWWLPGTGMQRGNIKDIEIGDPLTPAWPTTEYSYKIKEEDASLPKLPTQPIGYSDAREILQRLGGDIAPTEWQGGLKNLTYHLGPNFIENNLTISLSTHNFNAMYESFNVFGIIKGSIEPDRYVMMGNHRDAWGFGASDPSSGTAQMLETVRVYGSLLAEGWRPRRTIIFCSWGAEEYGLLGSMEWVEEHVDKLQSRGVAYFNTDTCASGPILKIDASPMLWDAIYDIQKLIPSTEDKIKYSSIYDELKAYYEEIDPLAQEKPVLKHLGSGSDYSGFAHFAGIPSADYRFRKDERRYNIAGKYPHYHTGYGTYHMVSTIMDPEFKFTQGCGRMVALSLKYFADSSVLPFSIIRLPIEMMKNLQTFAQRDQLIQIYDKYYLLEEAVQNLTMITQDFMNQSMNFENKTDLQLRIVNDQIMKLEQSFITPGGLPGRSSIRNAIFGPSQYDTYASSGFPYLTDLMFDYKDLSDEEKVERNELIKIHISDLTIMTVRAASLFKETYEV